MPIIGQYTVALEEISAEAATGSRRGAIGLGGSLLGAAGSRVPRAPGRGRSLHGPAVRARPGSSGPPLRSAPSGRSLDAPSFASAAVRLAEVWRQVPEETGRLLRERLVFLARRLQEGRRSAPFQHGGRQ